MATKTKSTSRTKTIIALAIIGGLLAAGFGIGYKYVLKKTYYYCNNVHSCYVHPEKKYSSLAECNKENYKCFSKYSDCTQYCAAGMMFYCEGSQCVQNEFPNLDQCRAAVGKGCSFNQDECEATCH